MNKHPLNYIRDYLREYEQAVGSLPTSMYVPYETYREMFFAFRDTYPSEIDTDFTVRGYFGTLSIKLATEKWEVL